MITKLVVDNLKSIDHMELQFSNMNLLVGTNSSGKSTILQSILLFAQCASLSQGLTGDFVTLGTYDESKCVYSGKKTIDILVEDERGISATLQIEKVDIGQANSITIEYEKFDIDGTFDSVSKRFQYLSCHRIGPQNLYKKNMNIVDHIGVDGSYAISYLNQHSTDTINKDLCKNVLDYTLLAQVNWWLKYIVDAEINTEEISGADVIRASYSIGDGFNRRPQNIGSGVSYLISILVVCFASTENSIIILENPEIHLHPAAQAKVCEFLEFISEHNRQLFVETHSDHIFNGFRAGIANKDIAEDSVNIYFVSLNDEHISQAELVKIGRMGRIENQRKDLFDQFDIDINKMIGI